jgi:hypothetical protein
MLLPRARELSFRRGASFACAAVAGGRLASKKLHPHRMFQVPMFDLLLWNQAEQFSVGRVAYRIDSPASKDRFDCPPLVSSSRGKGPVRVYRPPLETLIGLSHQNEPSKRAIKTSPRQRGDKAIRASTSHSIT